MYSAVHGVDQDRHLDLLELLEVSSMGRFLLERSVVRVVLSGMRLTSIEKKELDASIGELSLQTVQTGHLICAHGTGDGAAHHDDVAATQLVQVHIHTVKASSMKVGSGLTYLRRQRVANAPRYPCPELEVHAIVIVAGCGQGNTPMGRVKEAISLSQERCAVKAAC